MEVIAVRNQSSRGALLSQAVDDRTDLVLDVFAGLEDFAFDVGEDENNDGIAVFISFRGDVLGGAGKSLVYHDTDLRRKVHETVEGSLLP